MSSITPNIRDILLASPAVVLLLGSKPLRFFPWSEAPEKTVKPYATYGTYSGAPNNYLATTADIDGLGTQIDIWSETVASCEDCFEAIRDALEPIGHLTSFQGVTRDPETRLYNARMEFDFWQARA